ncbi:MAG: alpha/beta hydrolase [Anaerolineae bacterium]
MFEGFDRRRVETSGAVINLLVGGSGPPLLLLHGYPQTHVIWHKIAPALAEEFTVVAPDLRGYGDSSKPEGGADHVNYSKRAMALDQVETMAALGFDSFAFVGHDRGGRVGHRLALDHPERITRLAVLDIAPTYFMYGTTDKEFATAYYHWFFLIQPFDFPERLIGSDPEYYLTTQIRRGVVDPAAFAPEAMAEYVRFFCDPAAIHATCEDYRAAATIDLAHDEADMGRKVTCPVLALWGARGLVGRKYDVLAAWRERAETVSGEALDCGHYLPEEKPAETLAALRAFLLS